MNSDGASSAERAQALGGHVLLEPREGELNAFHDPERFGLPLTA